MTSKNQNALNNQLNRAYSRLNRMLPTDRFRGCVEAEIRQILIDLNRK